jgi:hypothetical protein
METSRLRLHLRHSVFALPVQLIQPDRQQLQEGRPIQAEPALDSDEPCTSGGRFHRDLANTEKRPRLASDFHPARLDLMESAPNLAAWDSIPPPSRETHREQIWRCATKATCGPDYQFLGLQGGKGHRSVNHLGLEFRPSCW